MLGANIGIDLGTTSIVAYVEGKGVVVPKQKNYHIAKPFDI